MLAFVRKYASRPESDWRPLFSRVLQNQIRDWYRRQAFLLRLWEGMSIVETAAAMGCAAGSVKSHYARAVKSLRQELEGHWP
jgi:DNA-directed RNA polymerase specialized sigma24 family protein